jgi:hypothetical protein
MYWFIFILVLWMVLLTALLVPASLYRNTFDKWTKGKYRDDRAGLQIMLDHLRTFPETWSVSRDGAAFPQEGAKQIYLNYDKIDGWEYTLSNFGGKARSLNGYFEKEFVRELTLENNRRESQSLLRQFYPELNGQVLLK